jgi:uncharacterized phage protein gp47/JayE
MGYPVKDYRQIKADILRDIANLNAKAYTGDDSDFAVRAAATGNAIEGLYQHQEWLARQILPDTADLDYLIRHAAIRGITQKPAVQATGTIQFSGNVGAAVPIGTQVQNNAGVAFVTTAAGVIGAGGTVVLAAQAAQTGTAGNQAANSAGALVNAPAGVQGAAVIVSMTGGADIETQDALLARLLFDIQNPPHGGAAPDYYRWALEVAGVTDAYIFTQRRTANSVDVVIEASGGVPSGALITTVTNYINDPSRRPPCVDLLVLGPTLVPIPITAQLTLSGISLADATTRINLLLSAYFSTLSVGVSVPRSKLIALMMSVEGVVDVNLVAPAANVVILADSTHAQLATLGAVGLS